MNIKIDLTEQEIKTFTIRMNLVNKQQEQFYKLSQELQLDRETLIAIWKSIYQRWQLEDVENRGKIKFNDNTTVKLEDGSLICSIEDVIENGIV